MNESRTIRERLFALGEPGYRDFTAKLIPTVDPSTIIGVRMPLMRSLIREFAGTPEAASFLNEIPHMYYEENTLHGSLIGSIGDYGQTIEALDRFLPYVDNWATCDTMSPKIFRKHHAELSAKIPEWIHSDHPYTIRFGVGMRMAHFLEDDYRPEIAEEVASIVSDEYYVNMMIAWFFATALAKRYEDILPILETGRLSVWTHNKTIQKAVESYRITNEQKTYLRSLRIRGKDRG